MKVVHIVPCAPYNEGWGYQENLLPKYQALNGHETSLIITDKKHENGKIVDAGECEYISDNGFRVIRRKRNFEGIPILGRLLSRMPVYDLLERLKPDLIFYHSMVSWTIFQAAKYCRRHSNCVLVQDNHLDYNLGFSKKNLRGFLISCFYTMVYKLNDKYVSKVYGVTPWRQTYAEEIFGVPHEKCDLILMAADDDAINFKERDNIRAQLRGKHCIAEDEFLIVTGGKIDEKKNIHLLMTAVNSLDKPNVKLLVFGELLDDVRERFVSELSPKVQSIGWIPSDKTYDYFLAADLVVFPGQHSVLWEQACACKVPCVFLRWEGMEHVDNGGNSRFIRSADVDSIVDTLNEIIGTEVYDEMLRVANSDRTDIFLHKVVAVKSLEMAKKH